VPDGCQDEVETGGTCRPTQGAQIVNLYHFDRVVRDVYPHLVSHHGPNRQVFYKNVAIASSGTSWHDYTALMVSIVEVI
jgi:hypothetical protein